MHSADSTAPTGATTSANAFPNASATTTPERPSLDLPQLLMRRTAALGTVVLLLALWLGLLRMNDDIGDELDAAMALATAMATLGQLQQADDASAHAALATLRQAPPLRHLVLQVHTGDASGGGPALPLQRPPEADPAPMRWLLALHKRWLSAPDSRQAAWTVPRPAGPAWTVTLLASHDAERREAMASLVGGMALLLACVLGLLAVMRWNLRLALAPLGRLLAAIDGLDRQGPQAVQALPAMPVRELALVVAALRHLGAALAAAEQRRRQISQQMLTLQDDERARLARELHDEFGQHLTALRVDAAWLARQVSGQPALSGVVEGMARHCHLVQQHIQGLLARLQPFGAAAEGSSLAHGAGLLQALVDSWQRGTVQRLPACQLQLQWQVHGVAPQPWPDTALAHSLCLPSALWRTLYRISQEALTNSARHAGASQVVLRLVVKGGQRPGDAVGIDWAASDDGVGLADPGAAMARGNGLAGMQQRVWAEGGQLQMHSAGFGLQLSASFCTRLLLAEGAEDGPSSSVAAELRIATASP